MAAEKPISTRPAYLNPYGSGMTYPTYPGMNMHADGALGNMANIKSSLPGGHNSGTENSKPFMVWPSGQTLPMPYLYGHQQTSSSEDAQVSSYMQGNMPSYMNPNNMMSGGLSNYAMPYGISGGMAGYGPARRSSWSSNEDLGAMPPTNYYSGAPMMMNQVTAAQYTPGPIQPMKTPDNKNYEMVDLDALVRQDPQIPAAVPALWTNQEDLSLAKCLQNPEGITNIYIRGFMPDITDEDLHGFAARFGEIESCKAIVDQDTGKCKGFGFVLYYSPAAAENCIRGFFHCGFQASYAQKSRNARLKDLEDRSSTNIYCTGVPIDWNENDLACHFLPYRAVSTKICRDIPSGVSKEVGFARFESREIAEKLIKDFHNLFVERNGVKLFLRFADTKAQKQLKMQSQERRHWRSREYSYSVEHTPSPGVPRSAYQRVSPASVGSYISPAGASNAFTPATSVSPPELQGMNKPHSIIRSSAWPVQGGLTSITNTGVRAPVADGVARSMPEYNTKPAVTPSTSTTVQQRTPSPKKVIITVEPASGKENTSTTPK